METKEDNNRQGNLNSPTQEEELVVELNFDLMNTMQSLQVDIQIFKDDNMNERREKKAINEALLENLAGLNLLALHLQQLNYGFGRIRKGSYSMKNYTNSLQVIQWTISIG